MGTPSRPRKKGSGSSATDFNLKVSKNRGGYARDRIPTRGISVKQSQVPPVPTVRKRTPLLPGIAEALCASAALSYELEDMNIPPFTVSVDPIEGEWVLTLRGYDPGFDYYEGYKVRYVRSNHILNPLAKGVSRKPPPRR